MSRGYFVLGRKLTRRLKNGWRMGLSVGTGGCSLGALIIGVVNGTGATVEWWHIFLGTGLSVITGFSTAVICGTESLLPNLLSVEEDGIYTASFSNEVQLREANEWTIPEFGPESITSDVAVQWLLRNSKAFVSLIDATGVQCASFGMLGLRPGCVEVHMRGDLMDRDLKPSDVLLFDETRRSNLIYISGVVVRDPNSLRGQRLAVVLIWIMLKYAKQCLGLKRKRTLYAIAVTKQSKRLLPNLGFQIHTPGSQRKDGCDLYTYELTSTTWKKLMQRIGDQSHVCKLNLL